MLSVCLVWSILWRRNGAVCVVAPLQYLRLVHSHIIEQYISSLCRSDMFHYALRWEFSCYVSVFVVSSVSISVMICILRITVLVGSVIFSGTVWGNRHLVYGDGVVDFILIHFDGICCCRYYPKRIENLCQKFLLRGILHAFWSSYLRRRAFDEFVLSRIRLSRVSNSSVEIALVVCLGSRAFGVHFLV